MKKIIAIACLTAALVGIYLLNEMTRSEDGKSVLHVANELEFEVEAELPRLREIARTVQAPGDVEAVAEVDISSELVSKIIEMPVEEGDVVEKGALLCRLDDVEYRARLLSRQANVAKLRAMIVQAEADAEKAKRDLDRRVSLSEDNAASPIELADARTIYIGAKAVLEMRQQELVEAEAMLESAKEDLDKTVITAPIAGVVSELFAKQGEVVVTGTMNNPGTRIMVVSDMSNMQVRCRVDESDAASIHSGQIARIYLQSDTQRSVSGEVVRVASKGTKPPGRDVVTFETLVLINGDDDRVRPGMSANVEIETDRKQSAMTIPVEAVVYRKRRDLAAEFVERFDQLQDQDDPAARQHLAKYIKLIFCVEDGKASPRVVRTGISDAVGVEVLEGVALSDNVVTGPYRSLDQLKDGTAVKLKTKPDAGGVDEAKKDSGESESEPVTATASEDSQKQRERG